MVNSKIYPYKTIINLKRVMYLCCMKNKWTYIAFLVVILLLASHVDALSQCPMCRMSAESNLENGGTAGKGLNNGILYILSIPYLLVATLGIIWYKNKKKADELEGQVQENQLD